MSERLSQLPSVDEVLSRPAVRRLLELHPRPVVVRAIRTAVDGVRRRLQSGGHDPQVADDAVAEALEQAQRPQLRPVINATGVVLHTNLGRAPLAPEAVNALVNAARGYCNLELDLETGSRGSRHAPVEALLCELCGAEAALVVNNGAAAVWLSLAALASGRSCIVSRGELVEIGGGFRIPDVMRMSGAQLVEVGTTNRTRLSDYEAAVDEATALLVKVHRSNFALVGFTEEASIAELARLGEARGIPVLHDLGSGTLTDLTEFDLPHEPTAAETLAAGASVVTFSGDKLLGGPQAGIVAGKRDLLERIGKHPMARALRVDKLTVAALEATLRLHRDGRAGEVPALRMLAATLDELEHRATALLEALAERGIESETVETVSQVGGGSLPQVSPPSLAVVVSFAPADALHAALRRGDPAVVARVQEDRLLLDVRTLHDSEIEPLADAVAEALSREAVTS